MLLAHVFGLPIEELLGSLTNGALPAASALAIASIASFVRRRTG